MAVVQEVAPRYIGALIVWGAVALAVWVSA